MAVAHGVGYWCKHTLTSADMYTHDAETCNYITQHDNNVTPTSESHNTVLLQNVYVYMTLLFVIYP